MTPVWEVHLERVDGGCLVRIKVSGLTLRLEPREALRLGLAITHTADVACGDDDEGTADFLARERANLLAEERERRERQGPPS
jgi:hypothetical protein